jgi:hypothetical protein
MKLKGLVLTLATCVVLMGCSDDSKETVKEFKNVVIKDKQEERYSYEITVEKNGDSVVLNTTKQSLYDALKEGNTVNVTYYSKDFYIRDIDFVKLQEVKNK